MSALSTTRVGRSRLSRHRLLRGITRVFLHLTVFALGFFAAFPFLWILACSVRPTNQLYTLTPRWIPRTFTLESYRQLFQLEEFVDPLFNTLIMASAIAVVSTFVSCLAAQSLVRYKYPGRRFVTIFLLVSQMLPGVLLLLPLFILYTKVGLYNSRLGLTIAFTAITVPYSILLLRSYFDSLPVELEESAMIDGCSKMGAFWRITFPLSAPALAAVLLTSFIAVWNDVILTLMLSKDVRVQNISVALYKMTHTYRRVEQLGVILAMGIVITVPITLLFMLLQKWVVQGMTAGALKA
jgi:ABC-type glycerol-3-phosphate transport system permease component